MKTAYEAVLHSLVLLPVLALAGSIAMVCLTCRMLSRIGDRLAGERPWSRSGLESLRVA
jgi:hypothetical protein